MKYTVQLILHIKVPRIVKITSRKYSVGAEREMESLLSSHFTLSSLLRDKETDGGKSCINL